MCAGLGDERQHDVVAASPVEDTLQENTTYSFNFGQSIVDFNEGNPNDYLSYVMSTGPFIDSLQMAGIVDDALNTEADRFNQSILTG